MTIPRQPVGYVCDPCEFVTHNMLEQIQACRRVFKVVGIGVHSDHFFEVVHHRPPIKPFEERARLARSLKNVDFVFELTPDKVDVTEDDWLPELEEAKVEKKYHVAYAPGTYDLFHEGHLEHLLEARSLTDILIVGVNSDGLVYSNKKKKTLMTQSDRMEIVRSFKFVDYVYLVETNDKRAANEWAKREVGCPIDAIFLGSDLVNQNPEDNPDGIPLIFTDRDPERAKKLCSTYLREVVKELQK